ncbi:MAG: hypothetical protein KBD52_02615 [Candidatus Pacebacteria bacterium]|nr:hypothetical protein [Candidatus Paceibacterota bacterium]
MKNIIKHTAKLLIFISIFSFFTSPLISIAQESLVPCGTEVFPAGHVDPDTKKPDAGIVSNPCGFNDFLTLINTVIQFILKKLVLPIAAIMFAYAGFLYLTAGGNTGQSEKAKGVFSGVAIGLIIAVAAYLIISTLLSLLGYDGAWIGF